MENTFVVNEEPITIKITIEVIPAKKKEDVKEVPVVVPTPVVARQTNSPEGWDAIEPENPPVVPPVVPEPEKKKRAYTRKAKTMEPPVGEKVVETFDTPPAKPPVIPPVTTASHTSPPTSNKVVARLAQMINFFCKASGVEVSTITKKYLVEHGASDIFENIEGITDEMIERAIKEASGK